MREEFWILITPLNYQKSMFNIESKYHMLTYKNLNTRKLFLLLKKGLCFVIKGGNSWASIVFSSGLSKSYFLFRLQLSSVKTFPEESIEKSRCDKKLDSLTLQPIAKYIMPILQSCYCCCSSAKQLAIAGGIYSLVKCILKCI